MSDSAIAYPDARESGDLRKRGKEDSRWSFRDEIVILGPTEPSAPKKKQEKRKGYELCIVTYGDIGNMNYRFPSFDIEGNTPLFHLLTQECSRQCGSPNFDRIINKAVKEECRDFAGASDCFLPATDHRHSPHSHTQSSSCAGSV